MKKRWMSIALILCAMLALTGCGNAIPELTDEQHTMVTEYAAALLLKYDANYESKLLDDEHLAAEEEMQKRIEEENARLEALQTAKEAPKEEKKEEGETGIQDTGEVTNVNPAAFLEMGDVSVSYNGITYADSYPEGEEGIYFSVAPSSGCKIAVIHLDLINNGSAEADVNLFDKQARFKVSINGGAYHNSMMSLLEDDFSMYSGTLAPGQVVHTVLLVDLNEEECNPAESVSLYMKYNEQSVKTALYP